MKATIYHNPRCSKSRQTLALLEQEEIDLEIVEYLKTPLSTEAIASLSQMFDGNTRNIIRDGESIYKELNLKRENLTENDLIQAIQQNPILLQRPIVVVNNQARVGRPPESVLEIIKK